MSEQHDAASGRHRHTSENGTDAVAPTTGAGPAIAQFVILAVFWLLWSGHFTDGFLLGLGVLSCAGVALLCHRMGIVDSHSVPVHLAGRAVTYVPWLAWEVVKANVEVMRRIVAPRADDAPETIVVRPSQKSDLGVVSYANSITLTPGTFTLEADDDELFVHALTPASAEGLRDGSMDRRVLKLEGLSSRGEQGGETQP